MSHIPPHHRRLELVEEQLRNPKSELNIDGLLVSLAGRLINIWASPLLFSVGLGVIFSSYLIFQ